MHAGDLLDRLRRRYPAPQYALFAEVGDETGGRTRSADAIAMGLWRSRGIELQGFEIKVDRRDWLRELKNPTKAEPIARYCDRWTIVVSDPEIVREGELPSGWGLLVPRGNDLLAVVEAPKHDPAPMTRAFLAALMRAAHKVSPVEKSVAEAREAGVALGRELEGRSRDAMERSPASRELEALRHSVDAFEKMSGVKIDQWNGRWAGEAFTQIQQLHRLDVRTYLSTMRRDMVKVIEELDTALAATEPSKESASG